MAADHQRSRWKHRPGQPPRFVLGRWVGRAAAITMLVLTAACSIGGGRQAASDLVRPIADLGAAAPADGRLSVVASTSIVGDVVANIAGPDADVSVLVPPGADPHGFTLAPADLQVLRQAQAVLISGLGLEQPILTDMAAAGSAPIVSISEGIKPLVFGPGGQETESQARPPSNAQVDPHVWMDPLNVEHWAQNTAEVLGRLDPGKAADFQRRAAEYVDRLAALDRWIQGRVEPLPAANRLLVSDHYALGYFASRYDFTVLGAIIPAASTMAEPVPQDLATLEGAMTDRSVPVIFVESGPRPAAVDSVANDVGAAVVELYIGSLSPASGPAPAYFEMMQFDTERIVEALAP